MLDIKPEINVNVDGKLSHEIYTDGAKPLVQERQLPAFFYSLPRGSLKTATVA